MNGIIIYILLIAGPVMLAISEYRAWKAEKEKAEQLTALADSMIVLARLLIELRDKQEGTHENKTD